MSERAPLSTRADYKMFRSITTRWIDNDVYGHVNNAVYYSYFDTAVAQYLLEAGALDYIASPVVGFIVDSQCRYASPLAFPDLVNAGLRVGRIGNSSVRYEIGLFRNDDETASAEGHFVHVYVDRTTTRPVPLPAPLRAAVERLAA